MPFIISRRLNSYNDLDFLIGWDAKFGTTCSLAEEKALRFSTRYEAQAALDKAREMVPNWHEGAPIEYAIETVRNPRILALWAIEEALRAAVETANAAALAVWERDERQDRGSCGGAMLEFDARSKVAKQAEVLGITYRSGSEIWLMLPTPEGIRSQNADIPQAQHRAFRLSLEAAGYGKAVKKHWTYVD